jgi:hypothetical protein
MRAMTSLAAFADTLREQDPSLAASFRRVNEVQRALARLVHHGGALRAEIIEAILDGDSWRLTVIECVPENPEHMHAWADREADADYVRHVLTPFDPGSGVDSLTLQTERLAVGSELRVVYEAAEVQCAKVRLLATSDTRRLYMSAKFAVPRQDITPHAQQRLADATVVLRRHLGGG